MDCNYEALWIFIICIHNDKRETVYDNKNYLNRLLIEKFYTYPISASIMTEEEQVMTTGIA